MVVLPWVLASSLIVLAPAAKYSLRGIVISQPGKLVPCHNSSLYSIMDIASSVYTIAVGIVNFIAEQEDKDSLQVQISDTVVQIQNVIRKLLLRDVPDLPLRQTLQTLQNLLSNVDSHLRSWKESRGRRMIALVNPWAVTQEIKEDRVQLMNQYNLLIGAMYMVDHITINGYNMLQPAAQPNTSTSSQASSSSHPNLPKKDEALEFWHSLIGDDVGRHVHPNGTVLTCHFVA